MYSSYTAAVYARLSALAAQYQVNLAGAVSWSFEFENQPWFAGFRDLATNGVDKPVLNVFRMLGLMSGPQVAVINPAALSVADIRAQAQSQRPDIGALATADAHSATVLLWNYHNDDLPAPPAEITLTLGGVAAEKALVQHYRIDQSHSNAYTAWQAIGSPHAVSAAQRQALEQAGQLALLTSPAWVSPAQGKVTLPITLPRQGVSLLRLRW
jgi:xylan 1,4-beta-xylosidase